MANSAAVAAGDTATAAQYNNLRADVLDAATGHRHEGGTDGRLVRPAGLDPAGSSAGQVPTSTGSGTAPTWQFPAGGAAVFGDGSDGDVTISVDTTLSRDMYYNNLTINSGMRLTTAGFRVFVKNTITNNGYISNNGGNGGNGTSSVAGAAGAAPLGPQTVGTGSIGGVGKLAQLSGGAGGAVTAGFGGTGGTGGTQVPYAGGAGGVVTAPTAAQGSIRDLVAAVRGLLLDGGKANAGSGGGGGGCNSTTQGSGGGGGGGGVVIVVARTIVNTSGVIEARGGNGGSASTASQGIGAGGGGGLLILVYATLTSGTESAPAGSPGVTGSTTGYVAPTPGLVLKFPM